MLSNRCRVEVPRGYPDYDIAYGGEPQDPLAPTRNWPLPYGAEENPLSSKLIHHTIEPNT